MRMRDLISRLPAKEIIGDPAVEVRGLAYHSGNVQEGFLFAAMQGERQDGKQFIPEALSRGARSLLVDQALNLPGVVQLIVPDSREALARLAAAFYGNPSLSLTVVGITGTNGKTTTSYLIEAMLQEDGKNVGVMGTINYRYQGQIFLAPTTTPESLDLQRSLRAMHDAGVTHAVLEVSSHALDRQRVRACNFDVALFTNLTRDHLDYHGSMQNYFQAKQLLFTRYLTESEKKNRFAVINTDDPWGRELSRIADGIPFRYGLKKGGEVWPEHITESPQGVKVRLVTPRGILDLESPLIGRHNIYNILAAVSVGEVLQLSPLSIISGIRKLERVPGRLERVLGVDGVRVFVDYAHTGDGLERVIETLREIRSGRLIVVFGCGGDRDRGKRAIMGRVASSSSDLTVITSDNPRREDPLKIIEEVERGVREADRKKYLPADLSEDLDVPGYVVIPDRREAIRLAVRAARPGDTVLIAGKGHEDYQILGEKKIHFDDREEAALALALRKEGGNH